MQIFGVVINNKVRNPAVVGAGITVAVWILYRFLHFVIPPDIIAAISLIVMSFFGFQATSNTIGTESP